MIPFACRWAMGFLRVLLVKTSATLKNQTFPKKPLRERGDKDEKFSFLTAPFLSGFRDGNANLILTPFILSEEVHS